MARLFQSVRGLFAALLFVVTTVAAAAQDTPKITLLPDTDLPGFDYSTIKDTTLDACQAACADDRICRAFTFNEKAKWCFLKSEVGEATAFKGATSGKTDATDLTIGDRARGRAAVPRERPRLLRPPVRDRPADHRSAARRRGLRRSRHRPATTRWPRRTPPPRCSPTARRWRSTTTTPRSGSSSRPSRWSAPRPTATNAYDLAVLGTNAAMNAFLLSETRDERVSAPERARLRPRAPRDVARVDRDLPRDPRAQGRRRARRPVSTRSSPSMASASFPTTSMPRPRARASAPCSPIRCPTPISRSTSSSRARRRSPSRPSRTRSASPASNYGQRYTIELRAGLPVGRWRDAAQRRRRSPSSCPIARPSSALPTTPTCCPPASAPACRSPRSMPRRPTSSSTASATARSRPPSATASSSARSTAIRPRTSPHSTGELVWEGQVDLVENERNALSTTAIPVGEVLTDLQPGAYVITAKVANETQDYWESTRHPVVHRHRSRRDHGRGRRRRPRLRPLALVGPAGRRRHRPPDRGQQRNPRRSHDRRRRPRRLRPGPLPRHRRPRAAAHHHRDRRPATTPSSMSPRPPST